MRMFCGFIWACLDVYALLSGLWVYKSFSAHTPLSVSRCAPDSSPAGGAKVTPCHAGQVRRIKQVLPQAALI